MNKRMKPIQTKQNNLMQKPKLFWSLTAGILTAVFVVFTLIVKFVDVKYDGIAEIGCGVINFWWRDFIGINSTWNLISNIVAVIILILVGIVCIWQVVIITRSKSLRNLPKHWWFFNLTLVGLLTCYLLFQIVVINYRPILVANATEVSYPSSHVLMIATVCPLLISVFNQEIKSKVWRNSFTVMGVVLLVLGIIARVLSGYHWFTDLIGGILLSMVLVSWYQMLLARYKLPSSL